MTCHIAALQDCSHHGMNVARICHPDQSYHLQVCICLRKSHELLGNGNVILPHVTDVKRVQLLFHRGAVWLVKIHKGCRHIYNNNSNLRLSLLKLSNHRQQNFIVQQQLFNAIQSGRMQYHNLDSLRMFT